MAKINSLFNFSGTFRGATQVRSSTYGDHVRAARGTHKPIILNDAFVSSGKDLIKANRYAKIIKDAVEPYRTGFRDGKLWGRLVSHFKQQIKEGREIDFRRLEDFELFKAHPLDRIVNLRCESAYNDSSRSLTLQTDITPYFDGLKNINGYQFTMVSIFIDKSQLFAQTMVADSSMEALSAFHKTIILQVPEEFTTVLICIKCEGCRDRELSSPFRTKGMRIVKVINIPASA